jgi:muscarinic acetylcholine receptor
MNVTEEAGQEYVGSVPWMVVFSVIFVVIISGNLLTILAIGLSRHLSSMTANQFIYSLAVTDLLVGLYIPYHLCFFKIQSLRENEIACIVRFMVPTFACTHSICKLLAVAGDRYIAILHPLHYNRYMTKRFVWGLIVGGWLFALALASVPIYWNNWTEEDSCDTEKFLPTIYCVYMLTSLFGAAWILMILVYVKIWTEARKHAKRIRRTVRFPQKAPVSDSKSFQVGCHLDPGTKGSTPPGGLF